MSNNMLWNKPEFTKLFLENEATLNHHYIFEHQQELYDMLKEAPTVKHLLKKSEEDIVDRCLRKLIGKTYKKPVSPMGNKRSPANNEHSKQHQLHVNMRVRIFQWAILMNYKQLARIVWERVRDGIPAAIGAVCLLRKLSKRTQYNEVKADLKAHAFEYENAAIGVLGKCFESDPEKCGNLLIYELREWGRSTCLRMAVSGKAKLFVAQPGVQHILNKIWMGGLDEETLPITMILVGFTFFPIFTPAIKFRHNCKDVTSAASNTAENNVNGVTHDATTLLDTTTTDGNITTVSSSRPPSRLQNSVPQDLNNELESQPIPQQEKLPPGRKIVKFYNAPTVTFWLNLVSYLVFLGLFAYVSMSNYHCCSPSWFEVLLAVWVGTLFIEEWRQMFQVESELIKSKLKRYFFDLWNFMDLSAIAMFYISFGLRFSSANFTVARILFALSFMLHCIRIVHIFAVHKVLGPKLIMVGKMIKDVMFFLYFLVVFLVAYGVASQSILYPNEWRVSQVFVGVFYKAYWQIYGELFLEEINYNPAADEYTCSSNRTEIDAGMPRCPEEEWIVPILFAIYLIFANVLLLNLLIAIFSSTYNKVEANTDIIWKFQQYKLIEDYYFRPPIPPPLIIISHIKLAIVFINRKIRKRRRQGKIDHEKETEKNEQRHAFKVKLQKKEMEDLMKWEHWHSETYAQEVRAENNESTENRIRVINDRVDGLISSMESTREELLENMNIIKRALKH